MEKKVYFLFVEYLLPRSLEPMFFQLLGMCCADSSQLSLSRNCLQSKGTVFPKAMPPQGQPTSNKGLMWSYKALPLPQFQTTLLRAILSPEFPVGLAETSAASVSCITVQLPVGQSSQVSFMKPLSSKPPTCKYSLQSVFPGNQAYDGTRSGCRELVL